ncbi:MAG: saccharopine dehydrogenase NADP-binding domain-containing protein [Bacteroidales bacterium]|nr:saccharopine dehydrogenase NADP-binding domain-containing protein [Bacteroidales bacterium]MCF8458860.1 saccharopine dehydrogenase NADP-binding domain-containing protein [Bacteroidales bacterium]
MKIVVLGAGLVGRPMAMDLANDPQYKVTLIDIDQSNLDKLPPEMGISTKQADLSQPGSVQKIVRDFDFVISAVPGFMGYETVKEIIHAGKDVVDIAFFPEEPYDLDDLAKKHKVRCIVDCGVAPGMSHILVGYLESYFDVLENAVIYVGGLPKTREWPYEYKAVFSPVDVLEEYTRPSRIIENGKLVVKPALSEPELLNFKPVGTLEAFNSDGLRTLSKTIKAINLKEKTLRYPGHIEIMRILRDSGFFDQEEKQIGNARIRPIDFTSSLLFPKWELKPGEVDFTIMQVYGEGIKNGKRQKLTFDLYDEFDIISGIHSMARTTGYTATSALRMLIGNVYTEKGLTLPEYLGRDKRCVDFLLKELEERGVIYEKSLVEID